MDSVVTIPPVSVNGTDKHNDNFDIVVLKFSDSKIPEWKEVNNKKWVLFGENNDYPEYLIYQYKKSGKHRAIVNGKCKYIFGGGLEGVGGFAPVKNEDGTATSASPINRYEETLYDVLKKSIKDVEIHGGFRWFITWNATRKIAEIVHEDFYKFRTAKDDIGGFYWKDEWFKPNGQPNSKEQPTYYTEFTGTPPSGEETLTQVFAYNEHEPGSDYYPLPEYVGCANYIDIDIEISKFHLSAIRNGMMPSKLIQFYTGEPGEDKKKEIEKRFAKKFAGSENAGKFVLVFNSDKNKTVDIADLSFSELDKQFDLLAKAVQQEIFTGHQVISPMLFGVKTEGQLGGNTELRIAYEIFINTYAKPKQENYEKIINYFGNLMNLGSSYKFTQLDPVGLIFDVKDVMDKIPTEFILEKLGVPKKYITPSVAQPGAPPVEGQQQSAETNDNIKNLNAKQHQQLLRIIRQYSKGQLTREAATTLLKTGLGLNDDDIKSILGIVEDDVVGQMQKFAEETEDAVIQMFNSCGDLKRDFHIVKSKKVKFGKDTAEDEINFYRLAFKSDVTITEASILDLIAKDKRITPEVIAKTLDTTPEYVTAKIAKLVKSGLIESKQGKVGEDTQIERTLTKPLSKINVPPGELETTEILVKYSYEGPKDDRNRPFCAKLLALDRIYSRTEIENISERLGYSVWERRGGWWTKPDGTHSPSCRHHWESHIVVRKKSVK
jgi:DNA-binding Lrp family transcriptional regulator